MNKFLNKVATFLIDDRIQIVLNSILGVLFLIMIPVALITGLKRVYPS